MVLLSHGEQGVKIQFNGAYTRNIFFHVDQCNCSRGPWTVLDNASPRGQNGRHFADDVFRFIFVTETLCTWIKISLKFVLKRPDDIKPALVQIIAWRRIGDKPSNNGLAPNRRQAIIWTNADLIHWRIYAALGDVWQTQSTGWRLVKMELPFHWNGMLMLISPFVELTRWHLVTTYGVIEMLYTLFQVMFVARSHQLITN